MAALSRGILAASLVFWMTALGVAADRAIIVLDASGSMWGQIDGKPKLEIARETLKTVLQTIPADMELGLMAYGHREKGSCEDIELVVPPAAGTASAIGTAADSMKFLGKTPLSAAVKQAAEALKYTEDKSTVILITDGLETCNADPCAIGTELEQAGIDFTAHVVGFGLTAEEGKQVACLAENTGGKYIQASDAEGLKDALVAAVTIEPAPEPEPAPAPEPEKPEFNFIPSVVLAEGNDPITDGNAWLIHKASSDGTRGENIGTEYNQWKANLEPGDYVVVARIGVAEVEQLVKIEPGQVYEPVFVLNAGTLIIHPRPSEGGDINDGAAVVIDFPGGEGPSTTYGDTRIILPAGEQKVTVKIGQGEVSETFHLAAGQTIEKDVIVGVGRATVNAFYAEGADRVDSSELFTRILKARKKIDGTRDEIAYAYGPDAGFDVPAGDYVALAKMGEASAEQPFNVRVGEAKDVAVILNAGVLAIDAPGGNGIEVVEAKKDIQGNRKPVAHAYYTASFLTTLPAGDYIVIVTPAAEGVAKKEAPATVKAGERTEVAIP